MQTNQSTPQTRNSGIDLFRNVSMLFVVITHLLSHGGILSSMTFPSIKEEVTSLILILSSGAVDCYALISGYVGIESRWRISSIVKLWLRVLFYSILITIGFLIAMPGTVGLNEIIKAIFPVSTNQYWYFTAFFSVFFFMPFMNEAIKSMSRTESQILVIVLFVVLSVLPAFFRRDIFWTMNGFSPMWLLFLYLIGAFIRKHGVYFNHSTTCIFICIMLSWGLSFWGKWFNHSTVIKSVSSYTSPFILIACICALMIFSKINLPKKLSASLCKLSSLSFSVYLIHDHELIRYYIIKDSFSHIGGMPTPQLIGSIIGLAILIFITGVLLDSIREKLFQKLGINMLIEKSLP